MSDVVYLREGSWPFPRLARLCGVSAVKRPTGLMSAQRGGFTLGEGDAAIAEVQRGRMVEIVSDDGLEPWIGWIDQPRYDVQRGALAVDCVDVSIKLGERHTGTRDTWSGGAGLIARDLLYQANARNAFGLAWDTTSEAGGAVGEANLGGSSVLDALNTLADLTGEEWWVRTEVTPESLEMYLHWGYRCGIDRSQMVYLRQGREISALTYVRSGIEESESVMVLGGGGDVADRPAVVRSLAPERAGVTGITTQPVSETHRRAVTLGPALAAERVVTLARETDERTLAETAETRMEGEVNTSEELTFSVNTRADWSLLGVGDTVTVIFEDPVWGTVQRTPRIWELNPGPGILEVKCFKQTWGLVPKLREHERGISELKLKGD